MIYVLGDIHGAFAPIQFFIETVKPKEEDTLILLGDAGINYYLNNRDTKFKKKLQNTGITFFVIRGNHEERPSILGANHLDSWHTEEFWNNEVYVENNFPNIKYALDGVGYYEIPLNGTSILKTLVIPGAYSVDKNYRLQNGWSWFSGEQLTDIEKREGVVTLSKQESIDLVLSHTCPLRWMPTDLFLPQISQDEVDNSMEEYLDWVYTQKKVKLWLWGHYHQTRIYPLQEDYTRPIMLFNDTVLCLEDYFETNPYQAMTKLF